ncbi:MAG: DUF6090 family protein [Candidatus Zhuqueibacterota bacterium]
MKKTKIDWINQVVELIVVIIGITLAFMIDRAQENYKASQLEKNYLQSFYDDIAKDSVQLADIIAHEENTLKNITRLIALLHQTTVPSDSILVILSTMSQYYPFFQNAGTYESLKNSGDLNTLSDYSLKEKIFKYYQRNDERKMQEQNFSSFLNSYFIPFLFEHIDLESAKIVRMDIIRDYKFKNLLLGYQVLLRQNFLLHQSMHSESLKLSGDIQAMLRD